MVEEGTEAEEADVLREWVGAMSTTLEGRAVAGGVYARVHSSMLCAATATMKKHAMERPDRL